MRSSTWPSPGHPPNAREKDRAVRAEPDGPLWDHAACAECRRHRDCRSSSHPPDSTEGLLYLKLRADSYWVVAASVTMSREQQAQVPGARARCPPHTAHWPPAAHSSSPVAGSLQLLLCYLLRKEEQLARKVPCGA